MKQKRYLLVYQGGIANIFEVDRWCLSANSRQSKRIHQGGFEDSEWIAIGLAEGGHLVASVGCNQAGDIIDAQYTSDLESLPFSGHMNPVNQRKTPERKQLIRGHHNLFGDFS